MRNPKFKVFKSVFNNQYYYNLRSDYGEKILGSEGYTSKQSCLEDIMLVKSCAAIDSHYESSDAACYTFCLKAACGKIIGRSVSYRNQFGRDTGLLIVKRDAPHAPVEDLAF